MLSTDWELQVLSLSLHVYAIPTYMQSSYREQEVLELVTHILKSPLVSMNCKI